MIIILLLFSYLLWLLLKLKLENPSHIHGKKVVTSQNYATSHVCAHHMYSTPTLKFYDKPASFNIEWLTQYEMITAYSTVRSRGPVFSIDCGYPSLSLASIDGNSVEALLTVFVLSALASRCATSLRHGCFSEVFGLPGDHHPLSNFCQPSFSV